MRIKRIQADFWPRLATLKIHGDEECSASEYADLKLGKEVDVSDALAGFLITTGHCVKVGVKPKKAR